MRAAKLPVGRLGPQRRRRAGIRVAAAAAVALALAAVTPAETLADHGTWTTHSYVYTDPNPSTYSGYTRVNASDRYDYAVTNFQVFIPSGNTLINVTTVCGAVNEGCGLVRTPSRSWAQGGARKRIQAAICARDGSHELSGTAWMYPDECINRGLSVHRHLSALVN